MGDTSAKPVFGWMASPPRALRSPGVAGLLQPESQVFFLTLFDSRSVGRVSDVLAARLARAGIAESRMRELLAILTEAATLHAVQGAISVEVGLDPDALAIGWSWSPGASAFAELISGGEAKGWLDRLVGRLRRTADGVVLKANAEISAIELAVLVRHARTSEEFDYPNECELITVVFERDIEERPEVSFYQELGDEDFSETVGAETRSRSAGPGKTPEVALLSGKESPETELELRVSESEIEHRVPETRVSGDGSEPPPSSDAEESPSTAKPFVEQPFDPSWIGQDELVIPGMMEGAASIGSHEGEMEGKKGATDMISLLRKKLESVERERDTWKARALGGAPPPGAAVVDVPGGANAAQDAVRVSGLTEISSNEKLIVPAGPGENHGPREVIGGKGALQPDEKIVVGGSADAIEAGDSAKTRVKGGPNRSLQDEASRVISGDSKTSEVEERAAIVVREKARKKPKGFFGRLFSRGDNEARESEPVAVIAADGRAGEAAPKAVGAGVSAVQDGAKLAGEEIVRIPPQAAAQAPAEAPDARGKRMAEGMMTEIMAEKARLAEAQREVELSLKQKEVEFRKKIDAASREIKDREDEIRNRDAQITKLKEQLGNAIKAAERMKEEVESASLDAAFKQKYLTAERVVQTLRAENTRLERQTEELKAQQITVTAAAKTKEKGAVEAQQLREQMARLQKQFDDLRRLNQQLSERANKQNTGPGTAAIEDLRRKAEASVRVAAAHRKEAEALRTKMETLRKEEARLRVEVGRLQAELKKRGSAAATGAASPAPAAGTPAPGKKVA